MYKAVFLDMDGTLLRKDHSVSQATVDTIQTLTQRGIPVILVSARPLNAVLPTFKTLGLPAHYPIITLNGGYIVEAEKPIFTAEVALPVVEAIAREVKPFGATIAYYVQREWFSEVSDAWTTYEQRIQEVKLVVAPIEDLARGWAEKKVAPNKMMVMSEAENISKIQQHLRSLYEGQLNIYPSKPTYLEVMDVTGSKSKAVEFIGARLGIRPSEIIAMGDNYNDREMLQFAGMGVAMGNAPDDIKAVADLVTDTNNEDGVRKALEKLFNL